METGILIYGGKLDVSSSNLSYLTCVGVFIRGAKSDFFVGCPLFESDALGALNIETGLVFSQFPRTDNYLDICASYLEASGVRLTVKAEPITKFFKMDASLGVLNMLSIDRKSVV